MPDSSPSTLDIITLIVAIFGVALASGSLAWQTASFVLSGSRVRVNLRRGAMRRGIPGETARIAGPREPSESDHDMMRRQGFTHEVLIVEVRNIGRMAVSVESVSLGAEMVGGSRIRGIPRTRRCLTALNRARKRVGTSRSRHCRSSSI
jgi:hypothetical protein